MKRYVRAAKEEYTVSNPPPGWEIRNLGGKDSWIDVTRYEVSCDSYNKIKSSLATDLNNMIGYDLLSGPTKDSGIHVDYKGLEPHVRYELTFKSSLIAENYNKNDWTSYIMGDVRVWGSDGSIVAEADDSGNVNVEADLPFGISADARDSTIVYTFKYNSEAYWHSLTNDHIDTIQNFYETILKNFKYYAKQVFNINTSVPGTQSFIDKLANYIEEITLSDDCPLEFSTKELFDIHTREVDSLESYSYADISCILGAYDWTYILKETDKTQKFKLKCAPVEFTCTVSSDTEKSQRHRGMYYSEIFIQIHVPSYYKSAEISEEIANELGDANSWYQKILNIVSRYLKSYCKEAGSSSKKVPRAELDFDEWYNGVQYEDESEEFIENVTSKLEKKYPGCDVFEEPSTQGMMGGDFWTITMQDGTVYSVEFNYEDEVETLFTLGPKRASTQYANEIIRQIKSGEALSED